MSHRRHLLLVVIGTLLLRGTFLLANRTSLAADPDAYRLISRVISEHRIYGLPSTRSTTEPSPSTNFHSAATNRDDARAPQQPALAPVVSTAYRPPLYPLILALITPAGHGDPVNIAILHLALGVLTSVLVWLSARDWLQGSVGRAYAATSIVVLDPLLLYQSAQVMTETLAACLTIVIVFTASRACAVATMRWAIIVGCSLGLASLCRPTFLPLVFLLPASFLVYRRTADQNPQTNDSTNTNARANERASATVSSARDRKRILRVAMVSMLVALTVISPWVLRNRLVLGRWIATTTHGGYTLLLGNNDSFYRFLRERSPGEVWELRHPDQMLAEARQKLNSPPDEQVPTLSTPESELAREALAYQAARITIAEQPDSFALACFDRIVQFWRVLPHARSATESPRARAVRWSIGIWYSLVFTGALCGLFAVVRAATRRAANLRASSPPTASPPTASTAAEIASCSSSSRFPWGLCLLIILVFQAAHLLYWSNLRMRAPVMPLVALLAAAAGTRLCSRDRS
ncbi:MAG: glycosyltransferase family 39 protein [Planctomycetota bacterium]